MGNRWSLVSSLCSPTVSSFTCVVIELVNKPPSRADRVWHVETGRFVFFSGLKFFSLLSLSLARARFLCFQISFSFSLSLD